MSTTGTGEFTATIAPDGDFIQYTETYSGLQGTVTQSHIHVGQLGVNGSIGIFLCQTATNPDPTGLAPECPEQGSVSGEITTANVIAGIDGPPAARGGGPCHGGGRHPSGRCLRERAHGCLAGRGDPRSDLHHRQIR